MKVKNPTLHLTGLALLKYLASRETAFLAAHKKGYLSAGVLTMHQERILTLRRVTRPLVLHDTQIYNIREVLKHRTQFEFLAKKNCQKQIETLEAHFNYLSSFIQLHKTA